MYRPPSSKTVALDTGLDYHYLEWEGADAEHTVVLVHGFLDFAWGWLGAARAGLSERFHLVAPDMRGHGDSDRVGPGGYYYFFDYIADLVSFIEQVGRGRVSLVGHSMGGSICGYYTGTYPDKVHKLALLEGMGPPEMNGPMPERVDFWIRSARAARQRTPKPSATVADAAARLRRHDALLDESLSLELAEHGTRELEDGSRVFKHDPLHMTRGPIPYKVDVAVEFWQRIQCPTLVVEGAESAQRLSPEEAPRRMGRLPAHEYLLLDGAAHMMQRHRPAELASALVDFLSDSAL